LRKRRVKKWGGTCDRTAIAAAKGAAKGSGRPEKRGGGCLEFNIEGTGKKSVYWTDLEEKTLEGHEGGQNDVVGKRGNAREGGGGLGVYAHSIGQPARGGKCLGWKHHAEKKNGRRTSGEKNGLIRKKSQGSPKKRVVLRSSF